MATSTSSNGPTRLRDDGVFILNDFTLVVDVTDEVVIAAPVTAMVLFGSIEHPEIIVTPIVAGRKITVTMTKAQLALLPAKKATLNILFNGRYVIQKPMTPTSEGTTPGYVTESYSDNTLGIFRVSFYPGESVASLAEAAKDETLAARDEVRAALVDNADRVPGFLDDLAATILAGHDASYTSVAGGSTGGLSSWSEQNTATIDITNRIITIPGGANGAGTYMRRDFDLLSTDNLRVGDKINVRSLVSQTIDGGISDSVIGIRLYDNTGAAVPLAPVAPSVYDATTKTFKFDGQFTVTNTTRTYYIELYIKAGAPNQAGTVGLRWLDVGINQNKYLYDDAIALIDQAVRGYQSIAVTYDDRPVVTQIDLSGVTDVTAALQAEINLAISTSGKWEGRPGTPRITSSLVVNGRIEMDFRGMDLNVNIPTLAPAPGAEAFTIFTASPVILRNLIVRRAAANPAQQPTPVRFSASFINKNSIFEKVEAYNMPRGFTVDYCDNLTMIGCVSGGGQFYGLRAGATSPAQMTNLKLIGNFYEGYLDNHVQLYNAEGLLVKENIFRSASTTTIPNRSLEIIASGTGQQKGARILDNQFLAFREYGIAGLPVAAVTLRDMQVRGNFFDDRTPDSTDNSSRAMHFAGTAQNIDMLTVAFNDVFSKEIGLRFDNVKIAKLFQNNFYKSNVGGAYATSQGILGSNSTFFTAGNFIDSNLGVATNKATWGTELVAPQII